MGLRLALVWQSFVLLNHSGSYPVSQALSIHLSSRTGRRVEVPCNRAQSTAVSKRERLATLWYIWLLLADVWIKLASTVGRRAVRTKGA